MWDLVGYSLLGLIILTLLAYAVHYHIIVIIQDYNRFRNRHYSDNYLHWDERNLPLTKMHLRIRELLRKMRDKIKGFK